MSRAAEQPSWAASTDTADLKPAAHDAPWRITPKPGETHRVRCHWLWSAYEKLYRARLAGPFVDPVCASYAHRGAFEEDTVTVTAAPVQHAVFHDGRWYELLRADATVTVTHPDFRQPTSKQPLALTLEASVLSLLAPPDGLQCPA